MNTTQLAARTMAALVQAETALAAARREEARTAGIATRSAARAKTARAAAATARRDLAKAERTGKGVKAAARKADGRTLKAAALTETAREAKTIATAARRTARAAARRLDRIALRAAAAATRTVAKIAQRMGETSLTSAPADDRTLSADELPAVEEIETHAARYDDLDQRAKELSKLADAEKKWLRQLPVGIYGGVVITRTPGRSVLDGDQVALDYVGQGLTPPRKATRTTFKVDATALRAPLVDVSDLVEAPAAL
ncbi:hypothetical protein [Streptomyces sp. NE06-03C]|uniref:hypothetical protein n=1 Tax=Streptomyces sp. NE06-03C TaxID=3028694 RepID=UPI0029AC84A2|nr:hypothetical protein [Streptomyces sp. NE06-03C]MDX2922792.1 hypothetical protein [Streptomyces sp. NE06-03C]